MATDVLWGDFLPQPKFRLDAAAAAHLEGSHQHAVVEHRAQLRVCQRQSPQTQVGGRVGYSAQHKLNGVDHLVNHDLRCKHAGHSIPHPPHTIFQTSHTPQLAFTPHSPALAAGAPSQMLVGAPHCIIRRSQGLSSSKVVGWGHLSFFEQGKLAYMQSRLLSTQLSSARQVFPGQPGRIKREAILPATLSTHLCLPQRLVSHYTSPVENKRRLLS